MIVTEPRITHLKQDTAFWKCHLLAENLAIRYAKQFNLPLDSLQSVAYLALLVSVERHNPETAAITTYAYRVITNHLYKYVMANQKVHPGGTESTELQANTMDPARLCEGRDQLQQLSREAQEIISIILQGPTDVLGMAHTATACAVRKAIRETFVDRGYSSAKVTHYFNEIRKVMC